MKKTAIISGISSAVILVLFIVSVVITGVDTSKGFMLFGSVPGSVIYHFGGRSYSAGETTTDVFEGEIRDIYISTVSADTTVRVSDTDKATVRYTAGITGISFGASLENGKLEIHESAFFTFFFGTNHSVLEIELPAKEYGAVAFDMAPGDARINDLVSDKFSVNTASGHGEYSIFAKDIDVNTASGSVTVKNHTDKKADKLRISSASGENTLSGFTADSFDVDCVSGTINVNGVSGKGKVSAASGNINLSYADWNDDLSIDAASGTIDITLPAGSGAQMEMSSFAGSIEYSMDGEKGTLNGQSSAGAGGANKHRIDVDLASGKVSVHN